MAGPVRRPHLSVKTILLPGGDDRVREFVAREAPVPVHVVADPAVALGAADVVLLVVESVEPELSAALERALASRASYAVLVRRDVWSAGDAAVQRLLERIQQHPREKLIRFWRDRDDLERTIRDEVFALDGAALAGEGVPDGSFVKVGTTFEQWWALENCGFLTWEGRSLKEMARNGLEAEAALVPVPRTEPGAAARVEVRLTAPGEPGSYRSLWKMVGADGSLCFPSTPGVWCQVRAVY